MEELFNDVKGARDRFAGVVVTSGSAGTTASGDYLRLAATWSRPRRRAKGTTTYGSLSICIFSSAAASSMRSIALSGAVDRKSVV